jgi:DNA-binding NarL/FixJ family response regulator
LCVSKDEANNAWYVQRWHTRYASHMTTTFSTPIGEKLRVVIVDDHDAVREGLKRVVDHEHDMEAVGEARNGEEAIRMADALQPTIVLLDVSMPGMSGVEVTRVIRSTCPAVKVIAVTRHGERGFVSAMLEAGATGYVLKQSASDELVRAVRTVAAGDRYLDRALARAEGPLAGDGIPAPSHQRSEVPVLNDTEEQVLRLVAAGESNQEIAKRLSITTEDARKIKSDAMQKAGLATRMQVVDYVRVRGRDRR